MIGWQRLKKLLLYVSVPLALCAPAAALLEISYVQTAPRKPLPETGYVIPFSNHGTYIYITHLQDALLNWAFTVGILGVFVTAIVLTLSRKRKGKV